MPAHKDEQHELRRKRYAWFAVQQCNRQQLARVIWPWQQIYYRTPKRPDDTSAGQWRRFGTWIETTEGRRVKRGRASNPTAL
jgi:hypothetical protein